MAIQKTNKLLENQLKLFVCNTDDIFDLVNFGFFKKQLFHNDSFSEIKNIVNEFENLEIQDSNYHGLTYSLFALNSKNSKSFHNHASKIVRPFLETSFKSFKSIVFSYIRKEAGYNSEFFLHQDWNYTNEKKHQSLTGWLALQDISIDTGGMFFLKPEFRVQTLRSGSYLSIRTPSSLVSNIRLKKVSLKKGEVIFFQPSVFHGSAPNLGSESRKVLNFIVLPQEAPFLHYKKINRFLAEEYILNDSDIFENIEVLSEGTIPKNLKRNRYLFYNERLARKRIQKNLY